MTHPYHIKQFLVHEKHWIKCLDLLERCLNTRMTQINQANKEYDVNYRIITIKGLSDLDVVLLTLLTCNDKRFEVTESEVNHYG